MATVWSGKQGKTRMRLSGWGCVIWLLLLLASLGGVQYLNHGMQVWNRLQVLPASEPNAVSALRAMLAWDMAYLIAAFAVIIVSAGCVLRQEWARRSMRVVAALLALWALLTAGLMLGQWGSFEQARLLAQAQPRAMEAMLDLIAQARRSYLMALSLKVLATPVLLWLAWRLARLDVRAAFHARRIG
ncbi:MAG: hypothetical protein ABW154_07020 [Dyella sp.]